jgi:DNA-binding response OmpR family regulator
VARKKRRAEPEAEPETPRVLVVNDEDGLELLCRLLSRAGYEVDRAATPDETLARIPDFRPHCVVLDLTAGGIGQNLTLLDSIRGHVDEMVAAARVVLVASQSSNSLFSWQAGIDAFLPRPFHADELLHEVAESLARPNDERARHRRRELDAAKTHGRRTSVRAWENQRY